MVPHLDYYKSHSLYVDKITFQDDRSVFSGGLKSFPYPSTPKVVLEYPGVMMHNTPLVPELGGCDFKASLVYIESSTPDRVEPQ